MREQAVMAPKKEKDQAEMEVYRISDTRAGEHRCELRASGITSGVGTALQPSQMVQKKPLCDERKEKMFKVIQVVEMQAAEI